jgi:hypothetical protein
MTIISRIFRRASQNWEDDLAEIEDDRDMMQLVEFGAEEVEKDEIDNDNFAVYQNC